MPVEEELDVIVIGAGPTGENAADRAARGGLTTAIVESELVGGECSYWACNRAGTAHRGHRAGSSRPATREPIAGEVPLDRLWHAVPSYPTVNELWLRLLESYGL